MRRFAFVDCMVLDEVNPPAQDLPVPKPRGWRAKVGPLTGEQKRAKFRGTSTSSTLSRPRDPNSISEWPRRKPGYPEELWLQFGREVTFLQRQLKAYAARWRKAVYFYLRKKGAVSAQTAESWGTPHPAVWVFMDIIRRRGGLDKGRRRREGSWGVNSFPLECIAELWPDLFQDVQNKWEVHHRREFPEVYQQVDVERYAAMRLSALAYDRRYSCSRSWVTTYPDSTTGVKCFTTSNPVRNCLQYLCLMGDADGHLDRTQV